MTALAEVFFHKAAKRKAADIGGAIKLNTDWKILKKLNPWIKVMAIAKKIEITAPPTITLKRLNCRDAVFLEKTFRKWF